MKTEVYMERLWQVLTGDYPPHLPLEIPVLASLCYYALTVVLGRLARRGVRHLMPAPAVPYMLDLVTSFQLMACSLENGQIRKHYGNAAYIVIMFTMGMWSYVTIAGEASSNPCAHMIRYMQGKHSVLSLCSHVACQLLGGLSSFPYARLFWYLELTDSHAHRYRSLHCSTDLTVPTPIGFLLEFGATYVDVLLCLTTFTPFLFYEVASKSLLCCFVVVLGVDLTGMYMNPINATNQTFGCRGINVLEHIVVYWLSVLLAAVLGVLTHTQLAQCWKMAAASKQDDDVVAIQASQVTQQQNMEGEILRTIEDEVIEAEATEVTEDVIFVTAEESINNGESLEDSELSAVPLPDMTRGDVAVWDGLITLPASGHHRSSSSALITDFESEYDEMRRQERLNNTRNSAGGIPAQDDSAKCESRDVGGRYESRGEGGRYESGTPGKALSSGDMRREEKSSASISVTAASSEESMMTKDSTRHRHRSKSVSRIPVPRADRKRSTSRSRIPVMKEVGKRRSRQKSE